jgi:hypothetical protein
MDQSDRVRPPSRRIESGFRPPDAPLFISQILAMVGFWSACISITWMCERLLLNTCGQHFDSDGSQLRGRLVEKELTIVVYDL